MSSRSDDLVARARERCAADPDDMLMIELLEAFVHLRSTFAGVSRRQTLGPSEQDDLRDLYALRGRLTVEGACPEVIERSVDQLRLAQLIDRHGADQAYRILYSQAPDQPDDSRYRPRSEKRELRGVARATRQAASAVKAGTTFTDWQHRAQET